MDNASIIRLVGAVLAIVQLSLQSFGIEVGQEAIDATLNLVSVALVAWAAWKNNYVTEKGKKQKEVLEPKGLK